MRVPAYSCVAEAVNTRWTKNRMKRLASTSTHTFVFGFSSVRPTTVLTP